MFDPRQLTQLFSVRDIRNAALGMVVVFGGVGLSLMTLYAHQAGHPTLAGILAGVSLVFVLLIMIFVVPPLARNAGRETSQMNLPFDFTTGGAIMLVLILIVGFSAWNTGNNLLFLVLSFLIAAMVIGFFAGSVCLKKLDVKMRFPDTIFAGEPTPILVSLHNRKRIFPSFSVVAEVRGRERETSIAAAELSAIFPEWLARRLSRPAIVRRTLDHFVHVARGEETETKKEHVFPHRGRFLIKDFELTTRFPFGFFRHRRRLPARETELFVFPGLARYAETLDEMPLDTGPFNINRRGPGQDLLRLRDYQPNDDLRRIDWKATARTRHLTVRELAADDNKRITVYFDTYMPEGGDKQLTLREKIDAEQSGQTIPVSSRFEQGVSQAATILGRFTDEQAEVRLIIDGETGDYGTGRRHLYECLKRLAVVEPTLAAKPAKPGPNLERIFLEEDDSHHFLITASGASAALPEVVPALKIVSF